MENKKKMFEAEFYKNRLWSSRTMQKTVDFIYVYNKMMMTLRWEKRVKLTVSTGQY